MIFYNWLFVVFISKQKFIIKIFILTSTQKYKDEVKVSSAKSVAILLIKYCR